MRVIHRATGQIGTIPDDKFDPNIFEVANKREPTVYTKTPTQSALENVGSKAIGLVKPLYNVGRDLAGSIVAGTGGLLEAGSRVVDRDNSNRTGEKIINTGLNIMTPKGAEVVTSDLKSDPLGLESLKLGAKRGATVASYVTPAGKTVKGATALSGVSGALSAAGEEDATLESVAGGLVVGGAGGGTLQSASKMLSRIGKGKAPKATQEIIEGVAETTTKATKEPQVSNTAVELFDKQFVVPAKIAKQINRKGVSKEMVDMGIGGSFDDMIAVADTVTGRMGLLPKEVRQAVGSISDDISFEPMIDVANRTLNQKAQLMNTKEGKNALRIIRNAVSKTQGAKPNTAKALDLMDAIRELEELGYAEAGKSTYLTSNPMADDLADVYISAAKEGERLLEDTLKSSGKIVKSQATLDTLNAISPKLGEKYLKANSIRELRAIQSPFVKLKNMIDQTMYAQQSPFSHLSREATKLPIIGKMPVASDLIEMGSEAVTQRSRSGASKLLNKKTGAGGKVTAAYNKVVAPAAQAGNLLSSQPVQRGVSVGLTQKMLNQPAGTEEQPLMPLPEPTYETQASSANQESVNNLKVLMLIDPDNAKIYESLMPQGMGDMVNVGKVSADKLGLAMSGSRSLEGIRAEIYNPDGSVNRTKLVQYSLPGSPGARQLKSLMFDAVDNLLRARSGAAVPEKEVLRYVDNYMPKATDGDGTIQQKLTILENAFGDVLNLAGQPAGVSVNLGNGGL